MKKFELSDNKKEIKQFTINYIFNTHSFDLIKQLYINRI